MAITFVPRVGLGGRDSKGKTGTPGAVPAESISGRMTNRVPRPLVPFLLLLPLPSHSTFLVRYSCPCLETFRRDRVLTILMS